jgi:hypothetical protein
MSKKSHWQPIATAPRDGTPILVCRGQYRTVRDEGSHPSFYHPITATWSYYHPNATGDGCWRNYAGHKFSHATHWMPLPMVPHD